MIIDKPYYEDNTRISNSAIGWFLKKGPRFYRDMIDGKEEGLKLPQLERGTMIHEYILQPEEFWKDYEILDFEVPKVKQQRDLCEYYSSHKLTDPLADDDKSFLSFNVQTQLGFENKIKIYPINYLANNDNASDGVGRGDYLNTSIEFSGFDTVPVLIDNYKLSMTKSAYTRELSNSRQLTSQVRNVALGTSNNNSIQDRVSDAYSLIQNYGSKNMVKMGMNVVNGLQNEHQYYQQQH